MIEQTEVGGTPPPFALVALVGAHVAVAIASPGIVGGSLLRRGEADDERVGGGSADVDGSCGEGLPGRDGAGNVEVVALKEWGLGREREREGGGGIGVIRILRVLRIA
jgi:hypothetical protein